jgi:predicted dehydrogenase
MSARPVLVAGCGSIGRRHIGNLMRLGLRVLAYDPDRARAEWTRRNLGCGTVPSLAEGLDARPLAVWVCTPPKFHAEAAVAALARRVPCFIEKPLAHDAASARRIAAAARRARTPVGVGYQLRGHPALREIKRGLDSGRWGRLLFLRAQVGQYLPDWRPWQDYRKSYTARRALGGGILLDASHEIDLALWLAGEARSVFCSSKRLSSLKIDVEDTAALQLEFRSGALGEIHLDMVSRAYRRGLELAFEDATVLWDQPGAELRVYSARTKRWTVRRYKDFDFNTLYVREAAAFLRLARGRREKETVSAAEGLRALAVVTAAARSAATRRLERVLP